MCDHCCCCVYRSPSLVIVEDVHFLCGSSGGRTLVNALVGCLDDLSNMSPAQHVVVMATTNQIEEVDSSLRRPGRFEREIEVTTPSAGERREVGFTSSNHANRLSW